MTTPNDVPAVITVAVIDDHDVIHAGIHLWSRNAEPPIRIVANYATVEDFLAKRNAAGTAVDAVVLDLELQSRTPHFTALERIVDVGERVIVFSHLIDTEVILTCLDIGAVSYVAKNEGRRHLIEAIQAASRGSSHISPRMAGALAHDRSPGRPRLSTQETAVLLSWFQTDSKDLVAQRAGLSPSTVRTHLERARAKYAAAGRPARTKAALVARAIQDGLISANDL